MSDPTAEILLRQREPSQAPRPAGRSAGVRYRLAPGLALIPTEDGGLLFSLRPLTAMRLNAAGMALVSGLSVSQSRTADELAHGGSDLSPIDAAAFLDGLVRKRMLVREPAAPAHWPSVSIIVAAHGRPAAARACVESLLALDYPSAQVEILVVDDASDPPLAAALAGLPMRLLRLERNVGQSAARNLAAVEAEGELLAFIDDDCEAAPGWLRELVPHFGDPGTAIVGGRVIAPPSTGPVAAFEAVRSPLDMGSAAGDVGPRQAVAYLPTCNLIVRRDVFLAVGGFAVEMRVGEDVDFVWRVLERGVRARYAPEGTITHDHRVRLGALLRRRADYGASEADLQRRHPAHQRVMHAPRASLLVLAALASFLVSWPIGAALAALPPTLAASELAGKRRRLHRMGLAIPAGHLMASVLRAHAASLYHLGRDVTRYYGVPLVAIGVFWPPLLAVAAVLMLAPAIWDHRRLRPSLSLPAYVGLFWLEMAAYQLGVWRGCLVRRCWHPLLPLIRWRR